MRWWTWTLLGGVVVGAGVLFTQTRTGQAAADTPDGGTLITEPVLAKDGVVAEGTVVPVRYTSLGMAGAGVVQRVFVGEGESVKPGQLLLQLDRRELEARLGNAQAELQRAVAAVSQLKAAARPEELAIKQAALTQARSDEGYAHSELERLQRLKERAVLSVADVEKAQSALDRAAAARALAEADLQLLRTGPRPEAIAVAQAGVASARAVVQQVEALLETTELRAPMAGTVAYLEVQPGEFVTPGIPVVRLADTSRWVVHTEDLTELAVVHVHPGASVKITADAIPGLELPGRVTHVRPFGERKKGDMTYTVTVEPEQHDERLRWNMTVSVRIAPEAGARTADKDGVAPPAAR